MPTTLLGATIGGVDEDIHMADNLPKTANKAPVSAMTAQQPKASQVNNSPQHSGLAKATSVTSQGGGGSAQRISARDKKPIDYGQMAAGTGDISASMDYGEVSG